MSQIALPVLFALFVWWFGTGLVLWLVRIGPRKKSLVIGGATVILVVSAFGLAASADVTTAGSAFLAFTCAILAWCWLEITFLTGLITGPRTSPCPVGASGWRRVGLAISAILYHELALLAVAGAVVALTWQAANQVGAATFLVLWIMRLSAKLNLFLGVPFLNDELLPQRLGYLKSYFARRPVTAFFPVAVTASTILATFLVGQAMAASTAFETTASLLLAALVALAVLEHWFMVVPLPVIAIWEWSMGPRLGDADVVSDDPDPLQELAEGVPKSRLTGPLPRLCEIHSPSRILQSPVRASSGEIHGI